MNYLDIKPEVQQALAAGRPVVALESTIIAHGMPWPENVETALQLENAIREKGAVPATVAMLNGRLKAGLDDAELEHLGTAKNVLKLSRRDIPPAIAAGADGATTVAATMLVAHMAGIKVFVTGGIGGVHRGMETTLDISADLQELARTPVAVVCAGAKSILDLPRTLEYLETHGVAVVGYQTSEFPAFYTRESGLPAPHRLDSPGEIARMLKVQHHLQWPCGTVIANPIPKKDEPETAEMEQATQQALAEAEARKISGKQLTPFLLSRIKALTEGRSLQANIKLVLNNARLGAEVAVALSGIRQVSAQ